METVLKKNNLILKFRNGVILFTLFLISQTCFSQHLISGIVINKLGQELPYSVITSHDKKTGICADSSGHFTLLLTKDDSLEISLLGYKTKKIFVNLNSNKFYLIELEEQQISLNPIEVNPRIGKISLIEDGVIAKKPNAKMKSEIKDNFEICLILNSPELSGKYLKYVSYFIVKKGKRYNNFRVRLYKLNQEGKPFDDLLTHSLLKKPQKNSDWVEVNLENENIRVPNNGIGISIEWLKTNNEKGISEENEIIIGVRKVSDFNYCVRRNQGVWSLINLPRNLKFAPMIKCAVYN